jgi:hypothetical protein
MILRTDSPEEHIGVQDFIARNRARDCGYAEGTPERAAWCKGFARAYLAKDSAIQLTPPRDPNGLEAA